MTVLGPIDPAKLGATLMHEHLFIEYFQFLSLESPDQWQQLGMPFPETAEAQRHWNAPFTTRDRRIYPYVFANKDATRLDSVEDAVGEVLLYKDLGGGTIVEVTPINAGRSPGKLAEVARRTGVHVVMGTGFYIEGHFPEDMDSRSIDDLTYEIVKDIVNGAEGTPIRSGIIGEVGAVVLAFQPTESRYVRSLRAAARASRLTGVAITLHAHPTRPEVWHTALDVLEEEGADLSRVVVGHVTAVPAADIALLESMLRRGVYLQFDTLGYTFHPRAPLLDQRPLLEAIVKLVAYGHADRILVSHDVYTKPHLAKHGGFGFTFVHNSLVPYLRDKGVDERDIDTILERNPRRVLTLGKPQQLKRRESSAGENSGEH